MIQKRTRVVRRACAIAMLGLIANSTGCATRSKVSASNEIATAMFAIRDARANGADTYALDSLHQAESLLDEARRVGGAEAERLAAKAIANAQLAAAVAKRERARKQLAEAQRVEREAQALRERTTRAVEERLR